MRNFATMTTFCIIVLAALQGMATAQTASPDQVLPPKKPYLALDIAPNEQGNWDNPTWRNRHLVTIKKILMGGEPLAPNRTLFENWYKYYELRRLLQKGNTDPEQLSNSKLDLDSPEEVRRNLIRRHLKTAKPEDVIKSLNQLTLDFMKKVVKANCHPAVRYNAMLIVGELDERKEVTIGAMKSPAVPHGDAFDFMLEQLTNHKQIDSVRIAALIGIRRHCFSLWPSAFGEA